MKRFIMLLAWMAPLGIVGAPFAVAEDNQTTTITTGMDNAGTNYFFGYGTNNTLLISSGGQLTNVARGQMGFAPDGQGNRMLVTDPGSFWQSSGALQLGDNGGYGADHNWLIVSNGAVVRSTASKDNPAIGGQLGASNHVLVTGAGSVWSNMGTASAYGLIVGFNRGGNSLTVRDGGAVVSEGATIGGETNGRENAVLVADPGSTWDAWGGGDAYLTVGKSSSGNSLTISNGGFVRNSIGYVGGYYDGDKSQSNNYVVVTGSGSLWTNTDKIHITGSGNQLFVRDGGQVVSDGGSLTISNNLALVTDHESLWRQTGDFTIGENGRNNTLVISNGGTVWGTKVFLGSSTGSERNQAIVTGVGSVWTNSGILYIGYTKSAGNELWILNGGAVFNREAWIDSTAAGSSNNTITISGAGSLWKNAAEVYLGMISGEGGNRIFVSDAGTLVAGGVLYLGYDGGSVSNLVQVSSGGILEASSLQIGAGAGNQLLNQGGVFQFTAATPTIDAGGPGRIVMTNGVLSFRGIANASPLIGGTPFANITFQGDNSFQLNSATNAVGLASYTFDSVANTGAPTNFQSLVLAGSGSLWRSDHLQVGAGGAIRGSGTIQADAVTNQGTISPGHSPGELTFTSNLTLTGSSLLVLEIAGTNAGAYDRLIVQGTLTLGGGVLVSNLGYTFHGGEVFDFVDAAAWAGSVASWNLPALSGGMTWNTSLFESQGIVSITAIPEPGAAALLGIAMPGVALLAAFGRRLRRSA